MITLPLETEKKLMDILREDDSKSDRELAKMLNVSHPTIAKYRKKRDLIITKPFLERSRKEFIEEYDKSIVKFDSLYDELEKLKTEGKTVLVNPKGKSDKKQQATTVPLSPVEKKMIIDSQSDILTKKVMFVNQPKLVIVMKALKDVQFPTSN